MSPRLPRFGDQIALAAKLADSIDFYFSNLTPDDKAEICIMAAQMILTREHSASAFASIACEPTLSATRDHAQLRWGDVEGIA